MTPVAVLGLGTAVPDTSTDNETLVRTLGLKVTPEWIVANTGIHSRHWLPDGQTTSDLAEAAARRALSDAGVRPDELDRVVLCTTSPDVPTPSTATRLIRRLGAKCAAFDLAATCAGFLYGLDVGTAAVRNGAKRVLVVCAEARSRYIDRSDHRAAVLFSDGAGAVVLGPSDAPGVVGVWLGAEGTDPPGAWIPAGGAELPTSARTVADGLHTLRVDGRREIFGYFVDVVERSVAEVLAASGHTLADVDWLVPHQGNALLTKAIAARLRFPIERTADTIGAHGNVSGASIPLSLGDLRRDGRIQEGQLVLMTAAGAGATFGAALVRWTLRPEENT